ncbi:UDP-N-acetylglucosamine 2-epimerase (non-hydrolyzing) [Arcobacter sp. KX21116]|uniref:non-hydrolyzing UDP-N-acetylglucosamine 2-epimerase n=1 Tax=Arcobacter iocasae TaxID=2906515 RepID=UPI0035D4482A
MKFKKILFIFGTRPEAIKMIPIYKQLKDNNSFDVKICLTAQHREMLDSVMSFFSVKPDFDLDIMQQNQTLELLTSRLLLKVSEVLENVKPDLVCVHGDTTTSFISSLSAFYKQIDVAHIEAGLRTYNRYSPFPEEINRQLTSKIAKYHFAPTIIAKENLQKENINEKNIFIVGNSVIDTLFLTINNIKVNYLEKEILNNINYNFCNRKFILITGHRRENFGEGFLDICISIKNLAIKYKDIDFIYPVHLNPNVQKPVYDLLNNVDNIYLIEPLDYRDFVYIMSKCYLILTDSGGIQEEAPSLGKPVLVMRDNTERPEALDAGTVKLVGTKNIEQEVIKLVENSCEYNKYKNLINPYGDGTTSEKITKILEEIL